MAGNISKGLIEKRRVLVGKLWVEGNSIRAITAELKKTPEFAKLSKSTVNKDIQLIEERLIAENTGKIDAMRARSVEVLRRIQRVAWDAIQYLGVPLPLKDKASYLRVIADCEEKIAKLQGTFAPVKTELGTREGEAIPVKIIRVVDDKAPQA
jgi:hypothetical protein